MNLVAHPTESPGALRFRLLGPVSAERQGRDLPLGGVKQRGLLAALLCRPGQVVPIGSLIEDIWGPDAPASAAQMVKVFVSRLRAALDDPAVIRTGQGGYRIDVECDQLDVLQARAALEAVRSGTLSAADQAERCAAALALWRGDPLADLVGLPLVETITPAVNELRRLLLDARMTGLLHLGRYEQVLLESRAAVAEHPFDDSAHGYLMHALYLAGRQAEALNTYREYHAQLADELGVSPSPGLVDLHRSILRQDPALHADDVADARPTGGPVTELSNHRRRRRRWAIAGATVVVTGAAAVAVALAEAPGPQDVASESGITVHSKSVAEFDGNSGTIVADTAVGSHPGPIVVDGGYVWVADSAQHTVTALSATTRAVTPYGLPTAPRSLTPGPGVVWIGLGYDGRLARILIASQELTTPFYPDRPVHGLVAAATHGTALWVATADGRLAQLDSRSLRIRTSQQLGAPARALIVGAGTAWTIDSLTGALRRTALRSRHSQVVPVPGHVQAIGTGFRSIWVLATSPNQLLRLNDAGRIRQTYPVPGSATSICVGSHAVWMAAPSTGSLVRLDPARVRPTATYQLGYPIGGIACDRDRVWVTLD